MQMLPVLPVKGKTVILEMLSSLFSYVFLFNLCGEYKRHETAHGFNRAILGNRL